MDGAHDVSVAVHESQEVLQAPAEASTAAQKRLRKFVVVLLQLLVEVLEDESDDAADGNDQRSEGQRAQVEAERLIDGAGEGEERNVVLAQRPIPAGEGSSENHFGKGGDEEDEPEEADDVDRLEVLNQRRRVDSHVETRGGAEVYRGSRVVAQKIEGRGIAEVAVLNPRIIARTLASCCRVLHARDFVLGFADRCQIEKHQDGQEDDSGLEDPGEDRKQHGR